MLCFEVVNLIVKTNKRVLVITDDSEETVKMAAGIVTALKGNKVVLKTASDFKGNDILPVEAFFLGCEKSQPESFSYLADLLKHINLSGRTCGVFSPGPEKTVKYLAGLLKDCEAVLNPQPLIGGSAGAVKKWAQNVLSGSF